MKKVSIKTINIISIIIPIAVGFIFRVKYPLGEWTKILPHINAVINFSTAVLLIIALVFIRKGNIRMHKDIITIAFGLGAMFLVGYVLYHISNQEVHFGGQGVIRYIYFFILISHILCSLIVLPFVLRAYYYGIKRMDAEHKKINKIAFVLWFYVSVTGVLAYYMISPYYV